MLLHTNPLFQIYFGNAQDGLFAKNYLNMPHEKNILSLEPYIKLKKIMQLKSLIFLLQVHGNKGICVGAREAKCLRPFSRDGDYLITNCKDIGLGVMTADCLPIILHDPINDVIALVHAGWRGSAKTVVVKAVEHMHRSFDTQPDNLRVFFGPSAKVCCYQVGPRFHYKLEDFSYAQDMLHERGGQFFFDLPAFNRYQLEELGVKKEAICADYNTCTLCDAVFCSYRRQGSHSCRQMSVVCLK